MENITKPGLGQISNLLVALRNNDMVAKNYDMESEEAYSRISKITMKQYKYFYALIFNGRTGKLFDLLNSLGFKPKFKEPQFM